MEIFIAWYCDDALQCDDCYTRTPDKRLGVYETVALANRDLRKRGLLGLMSVTPERNVVFTESIPDLVSDGFVLEDGVCEFEGTTYEVSGWVEQWKYDHENPIDTEDVWIRLERVEVLTMAEAYWETDAEYHPDWEWAGWCEQEERMYHYFGDLEDHHSRCQEEYPMEGGLT